MEPPFDPIDRWGTGWKPGRDGSTRRVVPHRGMVDKNADKAQSSLSQGQYCFEIRDSRGRVQYVSIPNTITPPRDPSTPRSETTSSGQLLPSQRPADPGGHQRQVGYNSEYPRENARSLVANRLTAGYVCNASIDQFT